VALQGDTLVVGAPSEDSAGTGIDVDEADDSASNAGSVYVFVRSGTTWSQQAYVKASNTGEGDRFGWRVALSGDTLAVGALSEDSAAIGIDEDQADDSASNAGAVYVFTRSGTAWSQQAYVKASNTDAGDVFGVSVALSGDTLAVGATGESSIATGVGGTETSNRAQFRGRVCVRANRHHVATTCLHQSLQHRISRRLGTSLALDGDTFGGRCTAGRWRGHRVGRRRRQQRRADAGGVYVFSHRRSRGVGSTST
jgi:hypothetical protein